MRKSKAIFSNSQYRFRRWSRNAWAVFASLRRVISIGNLSLLMIPGAILLERIPSFFYILNDEEVNDEGLDLQDEIILQKELILVRAISEKTYEQNVIILNINRNG